MESLLELIDTLQSNHIVEILIVLAGVLIVIDYFFPVDLPAHLGYICLGLATFFAFPTNAHVELHCGTAHVVLLRHRPPFLVGRVP